MTRNHPIKILWYGSDRDADGNPVIPEISPDFAGRKDGINYGELYIFNSDDNPSVYIRTDKDRVVPISGGGGDLSILNRLFSALDKDGNVIDVKDKTTPIASIRANYGLCGVDYVSAKGISEGGGGAGLITGLYRFSDLGGTFDNSANDTFNAYTINEIWKLAKEGGGGGIKNLTVTGEGNAVTDIALAPDNAGLVVTKGKSFFEKSLTVTGNGNAVTGLEISGDGIKATKGKEFLEKSVWDDFMQGTDADNIINKWAELEVFLQGMKETDNLATILSNKVDKQGLNRLFTALDASGNAVDINDMTKTIVSIRANYGFWGVDYVSAKGVSQGGSGSGGALYRLSDVLPNADNNGVLDAVKGSALVFDGTHWKAGTAGVDMDALTWANISGKPTTLLGYGITDAYTKAESSNFYHSSGVSNLNIGMSGNIVTLDYNNPTGGFGGWINVFKSTHSGYLHSYIANLHRTSDWRLGYVDTHAENPAVSWVKILHSGNYTQFVNPADYVTALGVSGNYVTWTKNGAVNNLTVPYATRTDRLTALGRTETLSNMPNGTNAYYAAGSNSVADKPSGVDAFGMLTMRTAEGWGGQLLMSSNANTNMFWRTGNGTMSGGWRTIVDSSNYSGILDGRYVTLGTNQSITGAKTFTQPIYNNNANGLVFSYGTGKGVFFRQDGADFYALISDNRTTAYNTMRPFRINMASGWLATEQGLRVGSGGAPGEKLDVTGNARLSGFVNISTAGTNTSVGYKQSGVMILRYNGNSDGYKNTILSGGGGPLYLRPNGTTNNTGEAVLSPAGTFAASALQIGNGLLRWDSANNALYVTKADGTTAGFYASGFVTAKGVGSGGTQAQSLAGLSDVTITNPTANNALVYNASSGKWENKPFSAGLDSAMMWTELSTPNASKKIDVSHIPTTNLNGMYLYTFDKIDANPATYDGYWAGMTQNSGIDGNWWHILSMNWASGQSLGNKEWTSQLALPTQGRKTMYYRASNGASAYRAWVKVLDELNYVDTIGKRFVRTWYDTEPDTQQDMNDMHGNVTFIGSVSCKANGPAGNLWYNVIQSVHRNGAQDGPNYVGQIALGMTGAYDQMYYRTHRTRAWQHILTEGNYTSVLDGRYVNVSGDTMTGPLNLKNNTWNAVGDDAFFGDCNMAGGVGIKSNNASANPNIVFFNQGGTNLGSLAANGTTLQWKGNTLWHAGNDGSGSGLDADLLDGWQMTDIVKSGAVSSGQSLSSYWFKMWDVTWTSVYNDLDMVLLIHSAFNQLWGILTVRLRPNSSSSPYNITAHLGCTVGNLPSDKFRLYYNNSTGYCQLWANCSGIYNVYNYRVLAHTTRVNVETKMAGNLYISGNSGVQTLPSDPYVGMVYTGSVNYANGSGWATKLQTARTFWINDPSGANYNSYSFDGTGNVDMYLPATMTGFSQITSQRFVSTDANGLRLKYGNYGVIERIDNSAFYLLVTASGSQDGSWNDLRPFRFSLANGMVTMNNGVAIGSGLGVTGGLTVNNGSTLNGGATVRSGLNTDSVFVQTGDPTLKIYSGRITDAKSDGNICFQTSIDNTDGQTHPYPTQYGARCNIVLQPRGGQVYIGQNPDGGNTGHKLHVNGTIYAVNNVYAGGAITAKASGSDIRLKKDIATFSGLDIIRRFRSITYHWNDTAKANSKVYDNDFSQYGLVAQDLLAGGFPQWVKDVFHDYYTIDYERLIPVLWRGVQETDDEVTVLKRRITELETNSARLENEVKRLKRQIQYG